MDIEGESVDVRLLQVFHELVFETWVRAPLSQQEADLRAYFATLQAPFWKIVATWKRTAPYLALPPRSARNEERLLFNSNIEILLRLFAQQCENSKIEARGPRRIGRDGFSEIAKLISDRYAETALSITSITEHLNLSARQVRRLFKQHGGCTFAAYLRAIRMDAAQDLLQTGSVDIKEVAWRVGYRSPSHFSKEFRTLVGYTPSRYCELVSVAKNALHDGRFAIAMADLR